MNKLLGLLSLCFLLAIASCRKDDNPKVPTLAELPIPLVTKDASGDQVISATDGASFKGQVSIDLYYSDGPKPQKMDLVVIKNGDKTKPFTIKEGITTFPTVVEVDGTQLISLFSSDIVVGDNFDFGVTITTTDGKVYPAFPVVGSSYGTGFGSHPGQSVSVRYSAVCVYDPEAYQGNFKVVTDEWADYSEGDIIPVTKIDDTHFSFKYNAFDAQPIIIAVDPASNTTSVTKQVYGNYGKPPAWPYGDISAESVDGSPDNYVAPCEGIVSVRLDHTVSAGGFGQYTIVLKKAE